VAAKFGIARETQDAFALDSNVKALAAIANGTPAPLFTVHGSLIFCQFLHAMSRRQAERVRTHS